MDKTENDDARFCGECGKTVYFVSSVESLNEMGGRGDCVAVWQKVSGDRSQNDPSLNAESGSLKPPEFEMLAGVVVSNEDT